MARTENRSPPARRDTRRLDTTGRQERGGEDLRGPYQPSAAMKVLSAMFVKARKIQVAERLMTVGGNAIQWHFWRGHDDFARDIAAALRRKLNGDTR